MPRSADQMLVEALASAGAVLLEGPQACGKTRTAEQCAGSATYLDIDDEALKAIGVDPALVLSGARPQRVDE